MRKLLSPAFRPMIIAIVVVGLVAFSPNPVRASQIHGHIFFASQMLAGQVGTYLAEDPQLIRMYILGAVAPDSLWVAHLATVPEIRLQIKDKYRVSLPSTVERFPASFVDVHRAQPDKVALSLLVAAQTTEESAYALGWITHYIVDAHIHRLINRWGGYSSQDFAPDDPGVATHNKLEALEARHIFTQYNNQLIIEKFAERDIETPGDYIVRAIAAAFPDNPAFQPANRTAFVDLVHQSEALMLNSSRWFYFQATHSPQEISRAKELLRLFRPQTARMLDLLTNLPDRDYLSSPENSAFIREWETVKAVTLASGEDILPLCVLYSWQHRQADGQPDPLSDELLMRIDQKLRAVAPSNDLICPGSL